MIRIIARAVAHRDTGDACLWNAILEATGEVLVARTEWPMADAAAALMARGLAADTPIVVRAEGCQHDSYPPMPISIPAAIGAKRAAIRDAALRVVAANV